MNRLLQRTIKTQQTVCREGWSVSVETSNNGKIEAIVAGSKAELAVMANRLGWNVDVELAQRVAIVSPTIFER